MALSRNFFVLWIRTLRFFFRLFRVAGLNKYTIFYLHRDKSSLK